MFWPHVQGRMEQHVSLATNQCLILMLIQIIIWIQEFLDQIFTTVG